MLAAAGARRVVRVAGHKVRRRPSLSGPCHPHGTAPEVYLSLMTVCIVCLVSLESVASAGGLLAVAGADGLAWC